MPLATRLRAIESDTAPDGLRERTFNPNTISDEFDLAEALLRADSIAAALRVLEREELAVLRAIATGPQTTGTLLDLIGPGGERAIDCCERRFLLVRSEDEIRGIAEVTAELERIEIPPLEDLLRPASPSAIASDNIDTSILDRRSVEAAIRLVSAAAAIVTALATEPARELAKGGLALPDMKRLASQGRLDLDEVPELMRIVGLAGLVCSDGHAWLASVESRDWLDAHVPARWTRIARAWWHSQPEEIREAVRATLTEGAREDSALSRIRERLAWRYPASTSIRPAVIQFAVGAEIVGVLAGSELTGLGRALAAAATAESLERVVDSVFPPEAQRVYVQPDYSIVVPGPPAPHIDRMLRRFADCEHADMASTYRLSPASLNRALASGSSIEEIQEFLESHSSTGIPQPVEFVLGQAAEQFGRVRVRVHDVPPIQAAVRALDPHLLEVLRVDQGTHALGFVAGEGELLTRASVGHTLAMLEAAKYPVALEDASGAIIPLEPTYRSSREATPGADPIAHMWTRITHARSDHPDPQAWLSRQITLAVKAKSKLVVEVRLPAGGTTEFILEPTGLAGGRMRARDRKADIERTFPLASIVAVSPA
ncbi:MAG TPA: helicase-associated domain-containing protein [Microbacteriaceae bacterium]|nr:helicase-associated domain-containing protein [Microbacteriaceae bacterium]